MDVAEHCTFDQLVKLQKQEKDATRARNLPILVLALQAWTAIAMAVGLPRRVVQSHVAAYNECDLMACAERRPRHPLANPAKQVAFVQALPDKIATLAAQYPDKKLRIYFQDEARFGQPGTLTNVWAKRGTRPRVVRQTAYQYAWVFAAVCSETGRSEGLISWRWIPSRGKRQMPANISSIPLPAYSPELNPIENLWHYLKSHHWSNRTDADHNALEEAVMQS